MEKTTKPITWKTWEPVSEEDFPCLHCNEGREATLIVTITNRDAEYNLPLCPVCAELPVNELIPGIK